MTGTALPVLMCLWNRPTRLIPMLEMIDAQTTDAAVDVYLWNNNKADHAEYMSQLESYTPTGRIRSVSIVKTPFNLGSIARFYWARQLVAQGVTGPVVVVDDDEEIPADFLEVCLREYHPRTAVAFWAWIVHDSYWNRTFAEPGDVVNHVGPGGMVCDIEIFGNESFFRDLPLEYWFLDDLWFTYFAREHGYELRRLPVHIDFVLDETNQYRSFIDKKVEFFEYLRALDGADEPR